MEPSKWVRCNCTKALSLARTKGQVYFLGGKRRFSPFSTRRAKAREKPSAFPRLTGDGLGDVRITKEPDDAFARPDSAIWSDQTPG